jgi:hypothetical protein
MWLAVDLDDTLLDRQDHPLPDAAGAMEQLLSEGHRVTIWTARFAHARTEQDIDVIKQAIELQLQAAGIPYSDIWTAHHKPQSDMFIGDNLVPFAGDWPKTLAQAHMMMKSRGTVGHVPGYEEHE